MRGVLRSRYIPSAARFRAREESLLSDAQKENLIAAKDNKELRHALRDTFIGPFLAGSLDEAVSLVLAETKRELSLSTPDPRIYRTLWIRYDFLNLKTALKGFRAGLHDEEIIARLSLLGTVAPGALVRVARARSLVSVDAHLAHAQAEADEGGEIFAIDFACARHYFAAAREEAERSRERFVERYVSLAIDTYNIRSFLRRRLLSGEHIPHEAIPGGAIRLALIDSPEAAARELLRYESESFWKKPFDEFNTNENFVFLERAFAELPVGFLRRIDYTLFSPARAFAFFIAQRNDLQLARGIATAKRSGVNEEEIRYMVS